MSDITDTGTLELPVDYSDPRLQMRLEPPNQYRGERNQPQDFRLASKTACVMDNGLYVELAATLAKSFGRVLYCGPGRREAFPRSNQLVLGTGMEGVERIEDWESVIDDVDVFVFPDIFHGSTQVYLAGLGKPVWGSKHADRLESERIKAKGWIGRAGLEVAPHTVVKGLKALRKYLKANDDVHVKSNNRGDMDTFHSTNYRTIEPRIDELEHALGAFKYIKEFLVEDNIKTKAEMGYDGYTIDGMFPKDSLYGVETKDTGYVGHVVPYAGLPKELAQINRKLSPLFRTLGYRGFWSSEIRVDESGTPFLIDPCCRMPSPPGELYLHLIDNLAEIIWHGAQGKLVNPIYRYEWGAQLILKSPFAEKNWLAVDFPEELEDHVKLHNMTIIDGRRYYVPQHVAMPELGAVVAGGNTAEEAIRKVLEIRKQIEAYDLQPVNEDALWQAAEGMEGQVRAA